MTVGYQTLSLAHPEDNPRFAVATAGGEISKWWS